MAFTKKRLKSGEYVFLAKNFNHFSFYVNNILIKSDSFPNFNFKLGTVFVSSLTVKNGNIEFDVKNRLRAHSMAN